MSLKSQMMSKSQGEFLVLSPGSPLRCHVVWSMIVSYLEMAAS